MSQIPKHRVPKSIRLKTWSRGNGYLCFGLKKSDAEYIAEQATAIDQDSVTVMSTVFPIITKCNITKTFTTTCTHLGNANISKFIDKYGTGVYAAAIEVEENTVVVTILKKIKSTGEMHS